MPRASRTGIRGLYRDGDGRWRIDLRWTDAATGERRRVKRCLPPALGAKAAKEHARRLLTAALGGDYDPRRGEPRRLASALAEYVGWRRDNGRATVEKAAAAAQRFVASFGDVPLADVIPFSVERFKRDRAAGGAGPATINRDLAVLSHFYTMAVQWGWVDRAHALTIQEVPHLKEPPGRVRHLSDEEEARLLAELGPSLLRVVLAAVLTGMRQGEVLGLTKGAVDLVGRRVTLTKTKANRVRHVPLGEHALAVFQDAMAAAPGDHVFPSGLGKPYTGGGLRGPFHAAVERAGLDDFRFHDLRHTLATRLRLRGAGLDAIAKILGHSSLAQTQRYAHLGEDTLRAAMESVPAPRLALALPPADGPPLTTHAKR